jgi:acetyl-CoA acetyltransferase
MSQDVYVVGVGMIPFTKPGANQPYPQMASHATHAALKDAGIGYELVQQAYVGYVYGDSTAGQRALYEVGMTGIPVVNVNNNCSTGSTALFLARQAVASGAADCVLALGFEHMSPGALGAVFNDRPSPSTSSSTSPTSWSATSRCRWRCATSAAPGWRTCSSTARRCPPSRRSAPRPAAMRRTTRWRCFAPSSPKTRSWPRPSCGPA